MKKNILLFTSFLYLMTYIQSVNSQEDVVLLVQAHQSKFNYSNIILKKIFLGRYSVNEAGESISPCYLDTDTVKKILYSITNKSPSKFRSYWNKRLFSGTGAPPKKFKSIKKLQQYLSDNRNSVCLTTVPKKLTEDITIIRIGN